MRAALIQFTASDQPAENLVTLEAMIAEAAAKGAEFVLTPEMSNIISIDRDHQNAVAEIEAADPILARLRVLAGELSIWLLIGSLALKTSGERMANRSILIAPDGSIKARYDKIHMFDVELGSGEAYRESATYRPGGEAKLVKTPLGKIGMTICYDMRFPHLYRKLAKAGADILTVPSAFTVPTGRAHWEVLLRARAIETGCFVLAPAQCGTHKAQSGQPRKTWGHSLAVSPWGEVLADGGDVPGITMVTLNLDDVAAARARIPALQSDRKIAGPAKDDRPKTK